MTALLAALYGEGACVAPAEFEPALVAELLGEVDSITEWLKAQPPGHSAAMRRLAPIHAPKLRYDIALMPTDSVVEARQTGWGLVICI